MIVHFPSVNFLWSNSCSTAEHSSPQTFSTPQKASNQFVKTQPAGLYPFPFISRSRMQSRNVHFDLFSSGADAGNGDILWKTEQLLSGMKLSMRSCERGVQKDGKQVAKKAALTEILSQNLAACFLASCCSANCRATAQSPRSVSPLVTGDPVPLCDLHPLSKTFPLYQNWSPICDFSRHQTLTHNSVCCHCLQNCFVPHHPHCSG